MMERPQLGTCLYMFTSAGEAAEVAAAWTEKLHESWRRL